MQKELLRESWSLLYGKERSFAASFFAHLLRQDKTVKNVILQNYATMDTMREALIESVGTLLSGLEDEGSRQKILALRPLLAPYRLEERHYNTMHACLLATFALYLGHDWSLYRSAWEEVLERSKRLLLGEENE